MLSRLFLPVVLFSLVLISCQNADPGPPGGGEFVLEMAAEGYGGFAQPPSVSVPNEPYHHEFSLNGFAAVGSLSETGQAGFVIASSPLVRDEFRGVGEEGDPLLSEDIPTPSQIWYFESDGSLLVDKTVEQLGSRRFDVTARRVLLADITGDDVLDVLLAGNLEDGRHTIDGTEWTARNPAYLSRPNGAHEQVEIGYRAHTHALAATDLDNDGVVEVIDGAYSLHPNEFGQYESPRRVYQVEESGTWSDVTSNFAASLDPDTFISSEHLAWADFDDNGCTDLIGPPQEGVEPRFLPALFVNDCSGGFKLSDWNLPMPFTGMIYDLPMTTWWGGEVDYGYVGVLPDGEWFGNPSVHLAKVMNADGDERPDYLYYVWGHTVSEESRALGRADEFGQPSIGLWVLLINEGDGFRAVEDPFGLDLRTHQVWDIYAVDLNHDGVDEVLLSVQPWEDPATHLSLGEAVYINDGSGRFLPVGDDVLVQGADQYIRPIPVDVDGDDRHDLVVYDGTLKLLRAERDWPTYPELNLRQR